MAPFEHLDPLIHAPVRLAIVTILASVKEADFTYLREATHTTDGNLSTHLTKLAEADYIHVTKQFVGKKPQTICAMTSVGREAYKQYLNKLEQYLRPPQ